MITEIKNYFSKIPEEGVERGYYDYLKGKRVAIVGPSPWLNDKKMGSYIDAFDVVVRINQGIYLPSVSKEDYGSRTDIIYLSQRARDQYKVNFPSEFDDVKYIAVLIQRKYEDYPPIKMFCYMCKEEICNGEEYCLNEGWNESKTPEIGHTKCIFPNLDRDYVKRNIKYGNKSRVIKRDLAYPQYKFGVSLLTGILAFIEMLEFKADVVEVIGFDFYNSIKKSIRAKDGSVRADEMYCKGYRIIKQSLNLSHKDIETDQFNLFMNIYRERKQFDTTILIDKNLKSIIEESMTPTFRFSAYDEEYKNFIKGKRVAFVGPGSWMEGKELGWLIDSFDVVVRPNMGIYLCQTNPADFGKKTNVVYLNQNLRGRFQLNFPDTFKQADAIVVQSLIAGDKKIKCKQCSKEILPGHEYYSESGFLDSPEVFHFNCYQYIDYSLYGQKVIAFDTNRIMKKCELDEIPLIGFAGICHILEQEPSQLYVCNIDFYDSLRKKIDECKREGVSGGKVKYNDIYADGYQILGGLSQEHKDEHANQLKAFTKLYDENKEMMQLDENLKRIVAEYRNL